MNQPDQARYFNFEARRRSSAWGGNFDFAGNREFTIFLGILGLPAGSHLLEVGCGTGRYTLPLLQRGYSVDGVDISGDSLKVLNQAYLMNRQSGWGNLEMSKELPDKNEYDGVICINLLHHVENIEKSIPSVVAKLRKGGILLAFEPNPFCLFWHLYFIYRRIWHLEKGIFNTSKKHLEELFKLSGLYPVKAKSYGLIPTRFLGYLRNQMIFDAITLNLANIPVINYFSFHHLVRGVKR